MHCTRCLNVYRGRTFRHSFREKCFKRRICRRRKHFIFLFSLRRKTLRGFVCGLNLPRNYDSSADSFPIVCNKFGDHDPNGMLYVRRICCTRQADKEGVFLFSDMADTRSGEDGTNGHTLFGALIIEPAGAEFLDPETWEPMKSGTRAVIHTADGTMHREFVLALRDFAQLFEGEDKPLPLGSYKHRNSEFIIFCANSTRMKGGFKILRGCPDFGETCGSGER